MRRFGPSMCTTSVEQARKRSCRRPIYFCVASSWPCGFREVVIASLLSTSRTAVWDAEHSPTINLETGRRDLVRDSLWLRKQRKDGSTLSTNAAAKPITRNSATNEFIWGPCCLIGLVKRSLRLANVVAVSRLLSFLLLFCRQCFSPRHHPLDMRRDVQEIFSATPHAKQVMMFSATLSQSIRPTCVKFMNNVGDICSGYGLLLICHW